MVMITASKSTGRGVGIGEGASMERGSATSSELSSENETVRSMVEGRPWDGEIVGNAVPAVGVYV